MTPTPSRILALVAGTITLSLLASSRAVAQDDTGWSWSGNARFRAEFNDNTGSVDRHRQRLRLRFGGDYRFNEEILVGARITTGNPDDARSPYVDLGDGFNSEDISLDRLFFQYTPNAVDGLTVLGGKWGPPISRNPVYGELVWDDDVQPEGLGAVYSMTDCLGLDEFHVIGAALSALEQGGSEESWAFLWEAGGSVRVDDGARIRGSATYFHYGDLTPGGSAALAADLRGNALTGAELTSDYGILDVNLAYEGERLVFAGEFIQNQRADSSVGDTGIAVGAAVKTEAGKFYYQYATIEQDAILTAFSQDDTIIATNYNSHTAGWKRPLGERMDLHVWVMAQEPDELLPGLVDDMVYRFRVDFTLHM
jgi:hypothetical protein